LHVVGGIVEELPRWIELDGRKPPAGCVSPSVHTLANVRRCRRWRQRWVAAWLLVLGRTREIQGLPALGPNHRSRVEVDVVKQLVLIERREADDDAINSSLC
jgi:hypothetical protein